MRQLKQWKSAASLAATLGATAIATAFGCADTAASLAADEGGNFAAADAASRGAAPGISDVPDGGEIEAESFYETPVATGRYVWIANPKSGRVAYVDAQTLEVRTVEAGNAPTFLAAVPGTTDDTAIVLNALSADATLLKVTAAGLVAKTFKTAAQANSWAISKDGATAIAWADARKLTSPPKAQGFQDLTVINLSTGASTTLAVGYRPVAVAFGSGGRAYAVTQDGITVIDLANGAPHVITNVAMSASPVDDPGTRDVAITPDGAYALVRRDGLSTIGVVSLTTGAITNVTLSGAVTDLDLTAAGDRAVAVVRDTAEVAVLPVPGIATQPATFTSLTVTGETVGSVALSADATLGLLYTNATPVERLTLLSLSGAPTYRTVKIYAPVFSVHTTPDAAHAIVLHPPTSAADANAFSLVPTKAVLPARIVATSAPPFAVATTNDRAVVAERDDAKKVYGAQVAKLPELTATRYSLASPPTAAGVIPSVRRAYVAQKHPEGRITFIQLDTGLAQTLTGFELAARVVDGSKP